MGQSKQRRPQNHFAADLAWMQAFQHAIESVMGEPKSPGVSKPHTKVLSISPRGTRIELELRFLASENYCCCEPSCFLATYSEDWWARLRDALLESTDRNPPPLTLIVHGVVEDGAYLRSLENVGLPSKAAACAYRDGPLRERDAK